MDYKQEDKRDIESVLLQVGTIERSLTAKMNLSFFRNLHSFPMKPLFVFARLGKVQCVSWTCIAHNRRDWSPDSLNMFSYLSLNQTDSGSALSTVCLWAGTCVTRGLMVLLGDLKAICRCWIGSRCDFGKKGRFRQGIAGRGSTGWDGRHARRSLADSLAGLPVCGVLAIEKQHSVARRQRENMLHSYL